MSLTGKARGWEWHLRGTGDQSSSTSPRWAVLVTCPLWQASSRLLHLDSLSLRDSPFRGKSWNTTVKRWGFGRRSFPEDPGRWWGVLGLLRPRDLRYWSGLSGVPRLSVEPCRAQFSGCKRGKRPIFLPAAFREARGPRALRWAERCPAESAMGSVVRGLGRRRLLPLRLHLPSRSAGWGRRGGAGPGERPARPEELEEGAENSERSVG